jgi:thiol-disulfide isomerase/thioredoxin
MYLKALTTAAIALCLAIPLAFLGPTQAPCLADLNEITPIASDPSKAPGKVLVVLVYDQHCKVWCTHVRPIIKELAEELGEKVHVEEIDNSPGSAEVALKQVKELGILKLYKDVESVPVVLIFDVKRKECKEINGPKEKAIYKAAIEKVIAKGQ